MSMITKPTALAVAVGLAAGAAPAQSQTGGAPAVYWVSAETTSGVGVGVTRAGMGRQDPAPAASAGAAPTRRGWLAGGAARALVGASAGGALGGALAGFGGLGAKKAPAVQPVRGEATAASAIMASGFTRALSLHLGSGATAAEPQAEHLPPAGLKAGAALPLVTPPPSPQRTGAAPGVANPDATPRGRMLIYWGCGETAPDPIVVDLAARRAGAGPQVPIVSADRVEPPSPRRFPSYGTWPNEKQRVAIAADGSLVGEHVIRGNYSPEIRFALNQGQDFMAPLTPTQSPLASGAVKLSWPAVGGATGYFLRTIGSNANRDLVIWSSSGVPSSMNNLMDWLPPSEVKRLVAAKAVLAPAQTECVVPEQVRKAVPRGMLQMIAYGDEVNFAAPPKPGKPKGAQPEWTAKVRFKSTTQLMLGSAGAA